MNGVTYIFYRWCIYTAAWWLAAAESLAENARRAQGDNVVSLDARRRNNVNGFREDGSESDGR